MTTRPRSALALLFVVAACGNGNHHPDGFVAGAVHGPALKEQAEDCRSCHGADLTGGEAPSCDGCHTPVAEPQAWRTNCTFCHGGVENDTGAPPRNIHGTDLVGPFPNHTIHVLGSPSANAFDCVQCHVKAIDVLSPGHVFDDTPEEAENDFGAGLSPQGAFDPASGSCSNLYCHGSGRGDDGVVSTTAGPRACDGCHASQAGGGVTWGAMSGLHGLHLGLPAVGCADCHQGTTSNGTAIETAALHIDGRRQVAFAETAMTFDPSGIRCTGACHGFDHPGLGWGAGGGGYHPAGFAAGEVHGTEMELQRSDCRGCHGADLTGGIGQSCDNCHADGWRNDCTFCHGGGLNDTGAPPRDLGSTNTSVSQSFVAHPRHVEQGVARAFDCVQCHRKPTDVLTDGHAFDATAGAAEITMSAGLSPAGTYNGNGTCSNLYCHGNGRGNNGSYTDGLGPLSCAGCHAGQTSSSATLETMSGEHKKHILEEGATCADCHATVAGPGGTTVIAPQLHVDGARQVSTTGTGLTWDPAGRRCTGACHGEGHTNDSW